MIEIHRKGTSLAVTLKSGWPMGGRTFTTLWDCGTEWACELLWDHMRTRLQSQIRKIREEEYKRGWKDAKAHQTKATWFSSRLSDET